MRLLLERIQANVDISPLEGYVLLFKHAPPPPPLPNSARLYLSSFIIAFGHGQVDGEVAATSQLTVALFDSVSGSTWWWCTRKATAKKGQGGSGSMDASGGLVTFCA